MLCYLARRGHGAFTRAEAVEAGVPNSSLQRRLKAQVVVRLYPGVYSTAALRPSWMRDLAAALAWGGESAIVSHRSAARLWQLPGFPLVVEISLPRALKPPRRGLVIHSQIVESDDRRLIERVPVTSPARTIVDLATVVERPQLAIALDDALRRRLVDIRDLEARAARMKGRRGTRRLRDLLLARGDGPAIESPLESGVFELLRANGIHPVRQYAIRDEGRLIARVDFAFPPEKLIVEVDGYLWHSSRPDWERDRQRRNELSSRGWRVLHVTSKQLREAPANFVAQVRRARRDR